VATSPLQPRFRARMAGSSHSRPILQRNAPKRVTPRLGATAPGVESGPWLPSGRNSDRRTAYASSLAMIAHSARVKRWQQLPAIIGLLVEQLAT
jgi:hypothetical protein